MLAPLKKAYKKPRPHIEKQRHHFADKGLYSQSYGFSSSRIWIWELDNKESWELKNWCFWTVVLEKTFESPLDFKNIKSINPKGNKSWIFIGRTDAEAETPILWPPDRKIWFIGKDPNAGKDQRQEEKRATRMRWLDSIIESMYMSLEQVLEVGDGQGSLACCSPWGRKQSDKTEQLNWTETGSCLLLILKVHLSSKHYFCAYNKTLKYRENHSV